MNDNATMNVHPRLNYPSLEKEASMMAKGLAWLTVAVFLASAGVGYAADESGTTTTLGQFTTTTAENYSTIVGYSAGNGNNSTGDYNTFIGALAGNANSSGFDNSFFGSYAGVNNTTGFYNSFFGRNAGSANTTGVCNSFFGVNAGYANTTGVSNSFFGGYAGSANTTGTYNSFFGRNAGVNNTTGDYNSFFGLTAGLANTVENYNTFVGYSADLNPGADPATNPVTNATAIGHLAYVAQSNSLVLGSIAGVHGATSNVNVGIGTPAPARQLHLKGDNAVFRMDRTVDTASFMLVRTDVSGNPLKTFVVGTNATGANAGQFVINDLGTEVAGPGNRRMTITNNGAVQFTGIVSAWDFYPTSSLAFKTNVRTYENALDTVNRLRGVRFDWKETGKPSVGLIAEEVDRVIPEVVSHEGGAAKGVNYASLVGVLVEAVKEQQAQRDSLVQTVKEQQEAMTKQEARINKQEEAIAMQQEINAELKAEINRLKSRDMIAQR
jgi:hypothetical protein